ncbi:GIY-YIG nuclease family protein [Salegentibacter sp. HM20]
MIEFNEGIYKFYIYILTNKYRTTFYIGLTNNMKRRLQEHAEFINLQRKTFVARYNLTDLIYVETYGWIQQAIVREKQLKAFRKEKKLNLIRSVNPKLESINHWFQ